MYKNLLGILVIFFAFSSPPAISQTQNDELYSLSGKCTKFINRKNDVTRHCLSKLASFTLKNGRVGFIFTIGSYATFQFSGSGQHQEKISKNATGQPLDRVTFTLLGMGNKTKPNILLVQRGACAYSNPYIGIATVICEAKTKLGTFSAAFETDGQPPQ